MDYSVIKTVAILVSIATVTVTFLTDLVTEETVLPNNPFVSIWNAPSEVCETRYDVYLNLSYFDIVANKNDTFIGDEIVIFYRLGIFPHYDKDGRPVYGGLPQLGNLSSHLAKVENDVVRYIPNPKFTGLAVIDWEGWRPIFERNYYSHSLRIYIRESESLVRKKHPEWPDDKVKRQATEDFETSARNFMLKTLNLCIQMRPHGKWGYYGFPNCYNYGIGQKDCNSRDKTDNDKLSWMFNNSGAILPSVYLSEKSGTVDTRRLYVFGQYHEALRVRGNTSRAVIVPYSRFIYRDTGKFYMMGDLNNTIQQSVDAGLAGVALWGSSASFRSKSQCEAVRDYIDTTLGPLVKNITNFALNCSAAICYSHGRCVRSDWNRSHGHSPEDSSDKVYYKRKISNSLFSFSKLFRKPFSLNLWGYINILTHLYLKSSVIDSGTAIVKTEYERDTNFKDYKCRCYAGWSGEFCQKSIYSGTSMARTPLGP